MDSEVKDHFMASVSQWVCDGYSIDVRYIGEISESGNYIWNCTILVNPLPIEGEHTFEMEVGGLVFGRLQKNIVEYDEVEELIENAIEGKFFSRKAMLTLYKREGGSYYFHSEVLNREKWFYQMHLHVAGEPRPSLDRIHFSKIDSLLRAQDTPFDGVQDIVSWLELGELGLDSTLSSIHINVNPPVDLLVGESSILNNRLSLVFHAHKDLDVSKVKVSVRVSPTISLEQRFQVAERIAWAKDGGLMVGKADIDVGNADAALVCLLVGDDTVRRQWFIEPNKARGNRHFAVGIFDSDLRMIKR